MDLTPGPEDVAAASLRTKLLGHQRWMAKAMAEMADQLMKMAEALGALELDVETSRAAAYRAGLQAANNAITWDTTCLNCSALLDIGIREREAGYREGLEGAARDILAELDRIKGRIDEKVTDRKIAACQKVGLHMASLRVVELSDRWSAGDQPRTPLAAETTGTESSPEVERADG